MPFYMEIYYHYDSKTMLNMSQVISADLNLHIPTLDQVLLS